MTIEVKRWEHPASWNRFVASTPDAHFQQSWEWGELAPELDGEAIRLGATRGGELVGAVQVFAHRISKIGRSYLYAPRGPALPRPTLQVLGPLLDAARAIGLGRGALGIRLEPSAPECSAPWKHALGALGMRPSYPPSQPRSSWVLDLAPEPDALLAGMKQKTRYNIRLALKKGVTVEEAGPESLETFHRLLRETAERDDFFVHPLSLYERMFGLFWKAGAFRLLLARHYGEVIAGMSLIRFGPTCWYLHGASSSRHRNVMAPYLLQWEAIQWAREQGCTLYDFRAVPDLLREDQDMYGVYRFKAGFGGRQVTALHAYAAPYRPALFGLWQLYGAARFALTNRQRRRQGLPIRQFS
jgi:peptidoglycan pentaglycine glycine transferase (the first glycine)